MHGNPVRRPIECRDQGGQFDIGALTQQLQRPGTVFSAAPGQRDALSNGLSAARVRYSLTFNFDRFCSMNDLMSSDNASSFSHCSW